MIITNVSIPIGEIKVSLVILGWHPRVIYAPHLHFAIRNLNKERINPEFFIKFKNYDIMGDYEKNFSNFSKKWKN